MKDGFRLPKGYLTLRDDLGGVLRARRSKRRLSQARLASDIGVSRETISRIENGRPPRPQVLDDLLHRLDLDWGDVAVEGGALRPSRPFNDTRAGDERCAMGAALRAGRRLEGLSLRAVAALCGMSAAQLSRVERGSARKSRLYRYVGPDDLVRVMPIADIADCEVDPRHVVQGLSHDELERLMKVGREALRLAASTASW